MNSSVMGYSCLSSSSAYSNPSKFPTLRIFHGPNFSSSSSLSFMSFPQNPRPPISTHHLPPNPPPLPPFNGRFKIHHRTTSILRQPLPNRKFSIRASIKEGLESSSNTTLIIVSSVITVILAVANRVLYKLALVPMKDYPFFLAQLTTFGFGIEIGSYLSEKIQLSRPPIPNPRLGFDAANTAQVMELLYRAGIVTDEMMAIPKSPFIVIGILEALGVAAGMSSGEHSLWNVFTTLQWFLDYLYYMGLGAVTCLRPGSVESSLRTHGMTFLVWQLAFSVLLLGRKYSWNRIAGCLLVAAGVVVAVASGSDTGQMLSGIGFVWPVLMIVSSAFQAGASILKESVFIDAANRLKGKLLDIFVVNSFGSGFQALFVFLFLPFLSSLKGIPFSLLPTYIKSGAGCFFNIGAHTLVPISIYILSLPLPYLPEGVSLSPFFLIGSMILVVGLILYNIPQPLKLDSEIE
ncbi:hypothetical protein TEA_001870 [Camellia sinensis var. sinensis]|uniref:Uncharacterized protein n=1 Tax=Camellia sinensis var. sinensis TaxID=542762 RepID=A0A4S4DVD5_CAMSN|nr:hypothetical protein TEA_001870 [Camellia sinensis var. sinensis]